LKRRSRRHRACGRVPPRHRRRRGLETLPGSHGASIQSLALFSQSYRTARRCAVNHHVYKRYANFAGLRRENNAASRFHRRAPGAGAIRHTRRALTFYHKQMLNALNRSCASSSGVRRWSLLPQRMRMGQCDCSFRAGLPGFVHVLDAKTLAYPEYRGNGSWRASATS